MVKPASPKCFNPRTREGCDFWRCIKAPVWRRFNPRTREGCDPGSNKNKGGAEMFQSTHPRGVRLGTTYQTFARKLFQSTHPRGVRLPQGDTIPDTVDVSIHAPARGATVHNDGILKAEFLFQSTHPRGVQPDAASASGSLHAFQSTHPRGVRPGGRQLREMAGHVSIHAPARGATWYLRTTARLPGCFNPRTREGCDISLR